MPHGRHDAERRAAEISAIILTVDPNLNCRGAGEGAGYTAGPSALSCCAHIQSAACWALLERRRLPEGDSSARAATRRRRRRDQGGMVSDAEVGEPTRR